MTCSNCAKAEGGKCMECEIAEIAEKKGFLQKEQVDKLVNTRFSEFNKNAPVNSDNHGQQQNSGTLDVLNSMHVHNCNDEHCAINNAKDRIAGEAFATGVNHGMQLGSRLQKRGIEI